MKKTVFSFLFIMMLLMPALTLEASTTKMGRLWEFIYDPSAPDHTADKNAAIQWMKNNFDEHNIPMMSITKTTNQSTNKVYGIDSIIKYNPISSKARASALAAYNLARPYIAYWPYYLGIENDDPFVFAGNGCSANLNTIKNAIDNAEQTTNLFPAAIPITITSEIKNGNIEGTCKYINTIFDDNILEGAKLQLQLYLVEGYHNYPTQAGGKEEYYFIPRATLYNDQNIGGTLINIPKKNVEQNINFSFPIDYSWNTKYLYVVGIIESFSLDRLCFDAAIDRVVDVKDAANHSQIKLNIELNNEADKFKKVDVNSTSIITYKIINPTNKKIKADVFINKNTSSADDWDIKLNKTQIEIDAQGNTTVTATIKAPSTMSTAAIDLAILPVETEDSENPVFSNQLIVLANKNVRAIAFAEKNSMEWTKIKNSFISNSYFEELAIVPIEYYNVIPPTAFEGYIFSKPTPLEVGYFYNLVNGPNGLAAVNWIVDHRYTTFSDDETSLVSRHLDIEELNFLNSVISEKKYLALFIDKSAKYANSSVATTTEKAAYNTLFNSLGVSFKSDTIRTQGDNGLDPSLFHIKGLTDDIGKGPYLDEPMTIKMNVSASISRGITTLFSTEWNITNPSSSRSFYYDNSQASNAVVKNTNLKSLIAGFGLLGADYEATTTLLDNITAWWFGYKPKLKPEISIVGGSTSIDFGEYEIGNTAPRKTIKITNTAQPEEGPLKIYAVNITDEEVFNVISYPQNEILSGEIDSIVIEFNPTVAAEYSNVVLQINSNDPNQGLYVLYLSGIAKDPAAPIQPKIVVSVDFINFNSEGKEFEEGGQMESKYINIFNQGQKDLTVHSIKLSDETNEEIFHLEKIDFTTVNPGGGGKDFEIWFNPAKSGNFEGTILIESDCPDNPLVKIELIAEVKGDDIVEKEIAKYFFCQVHPNPSSDYFIIKYSVVDRLNQNIKINIRDEAGKLIANVVDKKIMPGEYEETINTENFFAGTYFLEYIVNGFVSTKTIKIVK